MLTVNLRNSALSERGATLLSVIFFGSLVTFLVQGIFLVSKQRAELLNSKIAAQSVEVSSTQSLSSFNLRRSTYTELKSPSYPSDTLGVLRHHMGSTNWSEFVLFPTLDCQQIIARPLPLSPWESLKLCSYGKGAIREDVFSPLSLNAEEIILSGSGQRAIISSAGSITISSLRVSPNVSELGILAVGEVSIKDLSVSSQVSIYILSQASAVELPFEKIDTSCTAASGLFIEAQGLFDNSTEGVLLEGLELRCESVRKKFLNIMLREEIVSYQGK